MNTHHRWRLVMALGIALLIPAAGFAEKSIWQAQRNESSLKVRVWA